jgi:hypothetical protein
MSTTVKTLTKPEPKVAPDLFQSDNMPLKEQIEELLSMIAFKASRVANTGLEDMDDYFARATDFLGQHQALEHAVNILREQVEDAD